MLSENTIFSFFKNRKQKIVFIVKHIFCIFFYYEEQKIILKDIFQTDPPKFIVCIKLFSKWQAFWIKLTNNLFDIGFRKYFSHEKIIYNVFIIICSLSCTYCLF